MNQFIKKHEDRVIGTLSGWDRIRFRGTLRMMSAVPGVFSWLLDQGILLKQFKEFSLDWTGRLKASVEGVAAAAGRRIEYLASSALSKEALVRELLRREPVEQQGIVRVLSCVEPCRSYEIRRDAVKKQIDIASALRKCLHWYIYLIHPVWGLVHVRIQSWLPFAVHVCVNGREYLCRSLTAAGIPYRRRDIRNRDIRRALFGDAKEPHAIRQQSAKVSRLLRHFRDHGLIYRVKGTHRYQLSKNGRRVLPAFTAARNASAEQLYSIAS